MSGAKRYAIAVVLALVACAVPLVVAGPAVREAIVEPLAYGVWIGRLALLAVPQTVWWVLLIAIGSGVAVWTLSRGVVWVSRDRHHAPVTRAGPVRSWARDIERAPQGSYYHERLVLGLGRVAVAALSHARRATADEIRSGLATGQLDLPQDIRAFLGSDSRRAGAGRQARGLRRLVGRFVGPKPTDASGADVECMIRFLENEMGVQRGDDAA